MDYFPIEAATISSTPVPLSDDTLRYVLDVLTKRGVTDPRIDFFQTMLDTWHVLQVQSSAPTGREERVYDLEVGGDHEYQTGPLLSHNCERSADIVTATWIDEELMGQSRVQFQNLKSRDNKPFESFISRVEWPCRRILTCYEVQRTAEENAKLGAEVDKAAKALDEGK
jgi:hypothetical protein